MAEIEALFKYENFVFSLVQSSQLKSRKEVDEAEKTLREKVFQWKKNLTDPTKFIHPAEQAIFSAHGLLRFSEDLYHDGNRIINPSIHDILQLCSFLDTLSVLADDEEDFNSYLILLGDALRGWFDSQDKGSKEILIRKKNRPGKTSEFLRLWLNLVLTGNEQEDFFELPVQWQLHLVFNSYPAEVLT